MIEKLCKQNHTQKVLKLFKQAVNYFSNRRKLVFCFISLFYSQYELHDDILVSTLFRRQNIYLLKTFIESKYC